MGLGMKRRRVLHRQWRRRQEMPQVGKPGIKRHVLLHCAMQTAMRFLSKKLAVVRAGRALGGGVFLCFL